MVITQGVVFLLFYKQSRDCEERRNSSARLAEEDFRTGPLELGFKGFLNEYLVRETTENSSIHASLTEIRPGEGR